MPSRYTSRKLGVCWTMFPRLAVKVPYVEFEIKNPPPDPTVFRSRLKGPKLVPTGIGE
jgi:hypothetical protein